MSSEARQGFVWRHPALTSVDLVELVNAQISSKAWFLGTRMTHEPFTRFTGFDAGTAAELVADWSDGRVFSHSVEIRWRRAPGADKNDALLLTESGAQGGPPGPGFSAIGEKWAVRKPGEKATLTAWGSPVSVGPPNVRLESRLPREVHYPSDLRNSVDCLCYADGAGAVQFIRMTGAE